MNIRHVLTTLAGILIAMASIAGTACLLVTMQEDNSVWGLILLEGVIAIILHILAIVKVKRGSLTVYRSWADFGFSCAWPISIMMSLILVVGRTICEGATAKTTFLILAIAFAAIAGISLLWMFIGAFNNNKGKLFGGLIALSARTTASLLFLTWLSKLLEMKNKYEDNNVGIADYAKSVIGFIVFGIWFKMLVVPLVKDNREGVAIEEE